MELAENNPIKTLSFTIPSFKVEKQSSKENEQTQSFEIPETDICMSVFSNTVNLIITQTKKIGCIVSIFISYDKEQKKYPILKIEAYAENVDDLENDEKIYEIKTLFGQREVDIYELFARSIIDLFYSKERIFSFMEKELQLPKPDPTGYISPFYGKQLILNISLMNIKNQSINKDIYDHIMKNFQYRFMEFML